MATADHERKLDESRGAFNERMVTAMAVEQLDRVVTPLEDKMRALDRTSGRFSPPQESTAADTVMTVIRTLRRGPSIGALIEVKAEDEDPRSVTTLEDLDNDIAREFDVIVTEDSRRRFRSSFGHGTIAASGVYPTLAKNLYVRVDRFRDKSTVDFVIAGSEVAAYKRVTPEVSPRPTRPNA